MAAISFATIKLLAHAAERTLEMLQINHDAVTARLNVPVVICDAWTNLSGEIGALEAASHSSSVPQCSESDATSSRALISANAASTLFAI